MLKISARQMIFPVRAVCGGIVAMFLAFGVGRFAYSPLLPLMQVQAGLAVDLAGYLASAMYFGYLFGSVAVTKTLAKVGALPTLCFGLTVLVLGSWAMSFGGSFDAWALMMFCIGFSSAATFLATLSIVLGVFLEYGAGWLTAILYSGIGLAIVVIGFAIPEIAVVSGWQGGWRFVALTAAMAGIVCLLLLAPISRSPRGVASTTAMTGSYGAERAIILLLVAYALYGFANTIGSTFLVTMLAQFSGLQDRAYMGWVLVGMMVIPSCIIWPLVAARVGEIRTTSFLLVLLALANIVVVTWQNRVGVLVAVGIFGSSFLAIPGLVLGMLGKLAGNKKDKVTGIATIIFGASMVIGPSVGGYIAKLTDSFDWSLMMAGGLLLISSFIMILAEQANRSETVQLCCHRKV